MRKNIPSVSNILSSTFLDKIISGLALTISEMRYIKLQVREDGLKKAA